MNYRKQGLRALGLSILAALGLMAFTAAGAQASGTFLVQGLTGEWTATITGEEDNPLGNENKFLILNLNVEFYCHDATATGSIKPNGHGTGTITFSDCFAHGVTSGGALTGEPCELENSIVAKVLALVILHNSKPYVLFSPQEGETFATLNTEPCPIPSASVKGFAVVSISNPDGDDVTKLISSKGSTTLFSSAQHHLLYGKNEGHLDADANIRLAGSHVNLPWGAS